MQPPSKNLRALHTLSRADYPLPETPKACALTEPARPFDRGALIAALSRSATSDDRSAWKKTLSWEPRAWFNVGAAMTDQEARFWLRALTHPLRFAESSGPHCLDDVMQVFDVDAAIQRATAVAWLQEWYELLDPYAPEPEVDLSARLLEQLFDPVEAMKILLEVAPNRDNAWYYWEPEPYYAALPLPRSAEQSERMRAIARAEIARLPESASAFTASLELMIRYNIPDELPALLGVDRMRQLAHSQRHHESPTSERIRALIWALDLDTQRRCLRATSWIIYPRALAGMIAHGDKSTIAFALDLLVAEIHARGYMNLACALRTPSLITPMLTWRDDPKLRVRALAWIESNLPQVIEAALALALAPHKPDHALALDWLLDTYSTTRRDAIDRLARATLSADRAQRVIALLRTSHATPAHAPALDEELALLAELEPWASACPDWIDLEELGALYTASSGAALSRAHRRGLVGYLARDARRHLPNSAPSRAIYALDPTSRARWASALLDQWDDSRETPIRHTWQIHAQARLGDDSTPDTLLAQATRWMQTNHIELVRATLRTLRKLGTDHALHTIFTLSNQTTSTLIKQDALEHLDDVAGRVGTSREGLLDIVVSTCGLSPHATRTFDYGGRTFTAFINEALEVRLIDDVKKRPIKNLPKPSKKDDPVLAITSRRAYARFKKDFEGARALQSRNLEDAMRHGRTWTAAAWSQQLIQHPISRLIATRLLWAAQQPGAPMTLFRVDEQGHLLGDDDEHPLTLSDEHTISLPHPLDLATAQLEIWGQVMGDYEIIPPFEQLDRLIVTLAPGDFSDDELTSYKDRTLRRNSIEALVATGRWRVRSTRYGGAHELIHEFPDGEHVLSLIPDGKLERRRHGDIITKIAQLRVTHRIEQRWPYRNPNAKEIPIKQMSEALRDLERELARYA